MRVFCLYVLEQITFLPVENQCVFGLISVLFSDQQNLYSDGDDVKLQKLRAKQVCATEKIEILSAKF